LISPSRAVRQAAVDQILQDLLGSTLKAEPPHPDLTMLSPSTAQESGGSGKSVGIDAVKSFVDRLCHTPTLSNVRVGWIEPASTLTIESQNALLRFIEEPPRSSRVILSSRRSEDLISTLLSRCIQVRLGGTAGGVGAGDESTALAERFGEDEDTVSWLFDRLDDPEAVEKMLEWRLAHAAREIWAAVAAGRIPESRLMDPFLDKRVPAGEGSLLFVETVLSALCERFRHLSSADSPAFLRVAQQILVLQSELRYNPQRQLVLATVSEWLEPLCPGFAGG